MKKKIINTILLIVFLSMFIISLYNIIIWLKDNKHADDLTKELSEIKEIKNDTETVEVNVSKRINFKELKEINSDTVGWIEMKNNNVDYPFVQTNDNSYYLNHSFDKRYTDAGWIWLDYRNNLERDDDNLIIYGHARKDKSMFGTLKYSLKSDWYTNEENHIITIYLENETRYYQIFSSYHVKTENYYLTVNFNNREDFQNFLNTLKKRSVYDYGVDLNSDDKILTLSTCYNSSDKTVIHAKLTKIETY